ncbi:MAG: hypothetical protein ACI9KE_001782 [Polyangiales bacterium]|jgi:hypothetical protein
MEKVLAALIVIAALPSSAAAWHRLPPGADGWAESGRPAMRGVTVGPIESSLHPGLGYGTEASDVLLAHLAAMGANWVSITPFGRVWDLNSTHIDMDFEAAYEENRVAVRRVIAQAHAHGLQVLLIPHLWVETGGWRGEMEPTNWPDYQESYRSFVRAWARDGEMAGADALSIGVECKSWSGRFGGFWTSFIADLREDFSGLLTYSANWDEAEDVLFWDQLDFVGINAFYPLADHDDASDEEYLEGARQIVPTVEALADVLMMPVVFVEVGYTTRSNAAVEPWLWPDGMENVVVDEREQARGLDAVFRAFLPQDFFAGFFIWRYYAHLHDISQESEWGFSPHGKMAERVLRLSFGERFAADPSPWAWERL